MRWKRAIGFATKNQCLTTTTRIIVGFIDSTWKNNGQSNRGQKENCEPKKVRFRGCISEAKIRHKGVNRELHVSIELTEFLCFFTVSVTFFHKVLKFFLFFMLNFKQCKA